MAPTNCANKYILTMVEEEYAQLGKEMHALSELAAQMAALIRTAGEAETNLHFTISQYPEFIDKFKARLDLRLSKRIDCALPSHVDWLSRVADAFWQQENAIDDPILLAGQLLNGANGGTHFVEQQQVTTTTTNNYQFMRDDVHLVAVHLRRLSALLSDALTRIKLMPFLLPAAQFEPNFSSTLTADDVPGPGSNLNFERLLEPELSLNFTTAGAPKCTPHWAVQRALERLKSVPE